MSAHASKTAAAPAIANVGDDAAIRDELENIIGDWPTPGAGQTIGARVKDMERLEILFERVAKLRAQQLSARAPKWLSARERQRALEVIEDVLGLHPTATLEDLLWILAAEGFQARSRGAPRIWSGAAGRQLLEVVDAGLRAHGWARSNRKALRRVIGEIRDAVPDRYGRWSEEALRKGYYQALRVWSGKSPN